MFDAKFADALHIVRMMRGEGESPAEKFDRMARERLSPKETCPWWCSE